MLTFKILLEAPSIRQITINNKNALERNDGLIISQYGSNSSIHKVMLSKILKFFILKMEEV